MAPGLTIASSARVRAWVAHQLQPRMVPEALGEIRLAPHQRHAASRLLGILDRHGGALLADDVGLGKTFVALAVARAFAATCVVAPAALVGMWREAAARAGVAITVTSYEGLSRRRRDDPGAGSPAGGQSLAILDEAHHARSPHARRRPGLARLTATSATLLLTATPIPNRLDDLRALLALFLGDRAGSATEGALADLIVRRTEQTVSDMALPPVAPVRWIEPPDEAAVLERIVGLPPALPVADGGHADALATFGLARQWTSSRAALVAALGRRRLRAAALRAALATGHLPTGRELAAWTLADDAMQLTFAELVATPADPALDLHAAREALDRHAAAVEGLRAELLGDASDPDAVRAARLREIRDRHRGEPVLAFSEYADTVAAYWRRLRHLPGVARLTGRGGEIASGRIGREEVLRRFAPLGQRAASPPARERIELLLTTDLLSEGVDLRDATVIVHLDLPWSPARVEQRVGRARRLGSPAGCIHVYAFRPPAPAERLLAIERRLRHKHALAARAVGARPTILPPLAGAPPGTAAVDATPGDPVITTPPVSRAERRSAALDRVAGWGADDRTPAAAPQRTDNVTVAPLVAYVRASCSGWLALVHDGTEPRLVASVDQAVGDDGGLLDQATRAAEGPDAGPVPHDARCALAAARGWAEARAAERSVDLAPMAAGPRRDALARIRRAVASATPARRPHVARLAAAAHAAAAGRVTLGLARELAALEEQPLDDERWLTLVAGLHRVAGEGPPPGARRPEPVGVQALIVFIPGHEGTAGARIGAPTAGLAGRSGSGHSDDVSGHPFRASRDPAPATPS